LAPALAAQEDFTTRFLNEGKIVAYLNHPQIVNIYDLGSHNHFYYMAMEFLPGGTLEQKIEKEISLAKAVHLVKQIATALEFAHLRGVIHRDIKPRNIMFRKDGLLVLTDFGIARLMDGGTQLTLPGRTLGTPCYMSPEQISGEKVDSRTDLYSLVGKISNETSAILKDNPL
jgi:serine/threonine-protein kinase PpkA